MNRCVLIALSLLLFSPVVRAGEDQFSDKAAASLRDLGFLKGTREFEMLGGAFYSIDDVTRTRPEIDYAVASARLGWMLNDLRSSGFFAGNEEFLIEAFGGPIFTGPGNVVAGATLILRHNFVMHEDAWFVPFFQIGAGGVYNDVDRNDTQVSIGLPVEFNLQTSLGTRFRLNRAWSIDSEFEYRHISNAGTDRRNGGVDSVGFLVGLGHMF